MAQNWTSVIKSNWVFSKFCLLINIYIDDNIKSFKFSLSLILYIVLYIYDYVFYDLFIFDSLFSTLN